MLRPRRILCLTAALAPVLMSACAARVRRPAGPEAAALSTPAGPHAGESGGLRDRLRGTLAAAGAGGLVRLDLRTGQRQLSPLPPGVGGLSEPDVAGHVVRLHRRPMERDQHRLEHISPQGERRTLLSLGDVRDPARHLAFSPDGQTLAWVGRPAVDGADPSTRLRDWAVGPVRWLRLQDHIASGQTVGAGREPEPGVQAVASALVGQGLSWSPDSRHLFVVVHGPVGASLPPRPFMPVPDPQVLRVDTHTGEQRRLGPGRQVWAATHGRTVLVRQHRMALPGGSSADNLKAGGVTLFERDAWAHRPTDLALLNASASSEQPPTPLPLIPPDITAVVGWLEDRYLVYRGTVTPGAPSGLTTHNSPLVGPKPLESVKVMDVQTGEFLTVLEGVDPRVRLSVR